MTGENKVYLVGERTLRFCFPTLHENEGLELTFQRMLRVPDGETVNPLPEPLGGFPLQLVDDHKERLPAIIAKRAGVMFPVHPFEAVRISMNTTGFLPFLVKIGAGKINVLSGEPWEDALEEGRNGELFVRQAATLDGFYVDRGLVRQFVATPVGLGLTAEEQLTGSAEYAGFQISVYPLRRTIAEPIIRKRRQVIERAAADGIMEMRAPLSADERLGLMPGGYLSQNLFNNPFRETDWQDSDRLRCFAQPVHTEEWLRLTQIEPPVVEIYAAPELLQQHPLLANYKNTHVSQAAGSILKRLLSVRWFNDRSLILPRLHVEPPETTDGRIVRQPDDSALRNRLT